MFRLICSETEAHFVIVGDFEGLVFSSQCTNKYTTHIYHVCPGSIGTQTSRVTVKDAVCA